MANHFPVLDDVEVNNVEYAITVAQFSDSTGHDDNQTGTFPSINYEADGTFDQDAVESDIVSILDTWSSAWATAFDIEESVVRSSISVQRTWECSGSVLSGTITETMTYPAS